jgi:hypothetical protein
MAFGSGVLISVLAFELMEEAYARGGFLATGLGFVAGAAAYTAANPQQAFWLRATVEHGSICSSATTPS